MSGSIDMIHELNTKLINKLRLCSLICLIKLIELGLTYIVLYLCLNTT
jgi:hypothetical protein